VTAFANIGDAEAQPGTPVGRVVGFLEVTHGFAIVLFARCSVWSRSASGGSSPATRSKVVRTRQVAELTAPG
jgi:hypothetical protein